MSRAPVIRRAHFDSAVRVTPDKVSIRCKLHERGLERPLELELSDDELIELIRGLDTAMQHRLAMKTSSMTILTGMS